MRPAEETRVQFSHRQPELTQDRSTGTATRTRPHPYRIVLFLLTADPPTSIWRGS